MDQNQLDELAAGLSVRYGVVDNLIDGRFTYRAHIMLTNNSSVTLPKNAWQIYFCSLHMLEPDVLPDPDGVEILESGIRFMHINGFLFKFEPTSGFTPLAAGQSMEISFKGERYSVAKTDMLPNWYIVFPELQHRIIQSTAGESLSFIEPFDKPEKWKRFDYVLKEGGKRVDVYNPYTVEERYEKHSRAASVCARGCVIPTPLYCNIDTTKGLIIKPDEWMILHSEDLTNEATFLAEALGISCCCQATIDRSSNKTIMLLICETVDGEGDTSDVDIMNSTEAYSMIIRPDQENITLTGSDKSGVFYAVQTLLSLVNSERCNAKPKCETDAFILMGASIRDKPRFSYRGMHVDVARNFCKKDGILRLMDVMAMYKLNKLHLHLSDDEAWRIEIPGLEELTQIASKRGHDLSEHTCLLPFLGSGPELDSFASGYYTIDDYREMLRYAKNRHIEVIPEIDVPGHSYAAIKAMSVRYDQLMKAGRTAEAEQFLLLSPSLHLKYHSVQKYAENSIDPALESTYRFLEKVISTFVEAHKDICPLKRFHFGGDEVPIKAWEKFGTCQKLIESGEVDDIVDLMEHFVKRVAEIAANHGLDLAAWQDGILIKKQHLIERKKLSNEEVLVYAWQNVYESGLGDGAYMLANAGYKVVMAQATHLYFDHPYEPDPEERGLCWAARCTDTHKTFGFSPSNLCANVDVCFSGEPVSDAKVKKMKDNWEKLTTPENIVGVQGQIWTELIRTSDQFASMVYPRLLALAERAWHKADWEDIDDKELRNKKRDDDWSIFASCLGKQELYRLDKLHLTYNIPPPGAKQATDGLYCLNTAYPGLVVEYSNDDAQTWTEYTKNISLANNVQLRTKSNDGQRSSRVIALKS